LASQFSRTTQSLAKDSAALALLVWAVAGVTIAIWLAWFLLSKVNVVEVSRAAHLEVQQSPSPVAASISGKIDSMTLTLGLPVKSGDMLVRLNSTTEELRLREEESRLAGFPPRISSLRAEIAALDNVRNGDQLTALVATEAARFRTTEANSALEFSKDNEFRLKEESALGGVAQIDALRASSETKKIAAGRDALHAEERRLDADARTRRNQHLVQLESLKRAIVTLESERRTSEMTIGRLKNDIEKHIVRAPISGKIGEITGLRAGAFVPEGQKLATIVPEGELMIVADFLPAAALGRIRPGQISRLRLDGFPWSQFGSIEARVSRVATEIRDQMVRVELVPIAPFAPKVMMQHGLPGTVSVNLDQASPAELVLRALGQLTVPNLQASGATQALKLP
jgi:membrane fusion protein, adhesin transport system